MPVDLEITLASERLEEGSPEECAAFGHFTIRTAQASLTEGYDYYIKGLRSGPLVSGYHAAEWFAWNWWRLRWEPRSKSPDWGFAHCMTSIGEGYAWPNITIFSDGVRTALISDPSVRPDTKPFRYVGASPIVVPSSLWERAVDEYIPQVLGRLAEAGLADTNLHRTWEDIVAERYDPAIAERRRVEAMLGRDPDVQDDEMIDRLIADADHLGKGAVLEVAANSARLGEHEHPPLTAAQFQEIAENQGYDASPRDALRLAPGTPWPRGADIPAWRVGVALAKALRTQEHLADDPICDKRLAQMAGTRVDTLQKDPANRVEMSFSLDSGDQAASQVVLRSNWHTGRRFDLARLIGDRLLREPGNLHPATRAYTYRQKVQRAFAAEFLGPFEAVDAMLAGDYDDEEERQRVAEHFEVSPRAIETLLMNHGRLERDFTEIDFDSPAAA